MRDHVRTGRHSVFRRRVGNCHDIMVWSLLCILADFGADAHIPLFVCNEAEEIYLEVSDSVIFRSEESGLKSHQSLQYLEWMCCRVTVV